MMLDDVPRYHLYQWRTVRELGNQTCTYARGPLVRSFRLYKYLVAYAQVHARAAGYPKSRWSELYDWSQG